jgi:cobalamin biosynthesis protein CobC
MLNHGGQLQRAQRQYPEAPSPWLDLSTGIAPWSWPVSQLPLEVWQRLPEVDDDLLRAAKHYYHCPNAQVLAVSGSQVAIEKIPTLFTAARVALPLWGYAEHQKAWQAAGHQLCFYRDCDELDRWIERGEVEHAVVINPNNPSAEVVCRSRLVHWQQQLQRQQGCLLVDEAFADTLPDKASMASQVSDELAANLIVLRSVGKFFGLAGLRLGFVLGSTALTQQLKNVLPLWGVSHPAQWLGQRLLMDQAWQLQQRERIQQARAALEKILKESLPQSMLEGMKVGPLFISVFGERHSLNHLHQRLAENGIWIRFFEPQQELAGLRFGLSDDAGLARLRSVLSSESD